MCMKTIGRNLRNLRESKDLSSKELANALDINVSTYSKLENGKKSINVEVLRKITTFFSVSADDILGTNDPKEDVIMYMKRDKNMSDEDISEVQMILSMMDEAITLLDMK